MTTIHNSDAKTALLKLLRDPDVRAAVREAVRSPRSAWWGSQEADRAERESNEMWARSQAAAGQEMREQIAREIGGGAEVKARRAVEALLDLVRSS